MRIRSHGFSSFLAILGGTLFLVLPVGFLSGHVSIYYLLAPRAPCTVGDCLFHLPPMPVDMALFMVSLGVVGILLGSLSIVMGLRTRTAASLALALPLGLLALLFGTVLSGVLKTFDTYPPGILLFPELSVGVMSLSTVVFVNEVLRSTLLIPIAAEPKAARLRIHYASAIMAIAGAVMLLALPVAYLNGILSSLPSIHLPCSPYNCLLPVSIPSELPDQMGPFWASLVVTSVLLTLLGMKMSPRPRSGIVLGFAFSLASMALLFATVPYYIQETPTRFLLFPETSVVAVIGSTVRSLIELRK